LTHCIISFIKSLSNFKEVQQVNEKFGKKNNNLIGKTTKDEATL